MEDSPVQTQNTNDKITDPYLSLQKKWRKDNPSNMNFSTPMAGHPV
jgi:hypothetical protein